MKPKDIINIVEAKSKNDLAMCKELYKEGTFKVIDCRGYLFNLICRCVDNNVIITDVCINSTINILMNNYIFAKKENLKKHAKAIIKDMERANYNVFNGISCYINEGRQMEKKNNYHKIALFIAAPIKNYYGCSRYISIKVAKYFIEKNKPLFV